MRRLLIFALLLFSAHAWAQLATPSFGTSSYGTAGFAAPSLMSISGPTGATLCVGAGVTPTATTAGTCDTGTNRFTYSAAFNVSSGTFNVIATQVGQTNSAVATQTITVPTFSYTAGSYSFSPVVTLYPDYIHVGGVACTTQDGSTPTETANVCTHGTTYSTPITVSASETLKVLFTKSGQTDSSVLSAAYVITSPQVWFVRADGGTYYDANVTSGQCNGKYDAAYPGTGVNQNCAVNDVRYLWADNSGNPNAWIISGGDTVVIRGCAALGTQLNPSNPNCRLGYDNATSGGGANSWCGSGNPNATCFNPPVPMGSAAQPTKILGGCAYGTYTCTPINSNYPYGTTNETQLFGGFGLAWAFNLQSTNYVQMEGLEFTTHNLYNGSGSGQCTASVGTPAYPQSCSTGTPYSDFANSALLLGLNGSAASQNITLQDIYIHGMASAGIYGPLGGPITMTRVFVGYNAFAGWNFDDGYGTENGAGASIAASYVTMNFNGCYEEYPISHTYPARVCYDTNSGGFGDSWSGQGSGGQGAYLASFTCNYCVNDYNTKDGFIGPHIIIPTISITNSVSIGNMGSNWKWGGSDGYPNTTTFENNLTVNNCTRMEFSMMGVPSAFNTYLTGFCRAGGNGMASVIPIGSTWNLINNTFITAQQIALFVACSGSDVSCSSTINSTNNVFLGYVDPNNPYGGSTVPTLYYLPTGTTLNVSHNDEYGMQGGTCPSTTNGTKCVSPLLLNQPSQTWVSEAALDVFNPFVANNSFYPTSGSPLLLAGTTGGPSTDYYGVSYTNPAPMGGVQYVASSPTSFNGVFLSGGSIH